MSDIQNGPYEYLRPSVVSEFDGSGMQALLEALQAPEVSEDEASEVTSSIFTEILMLLSKTELDVDAVVNFMKLAISDETKAIAFCQVFDVFPHDDSVQALVVRLHTESVINTATLAQYIDADSLIKLDIVPSQSFTRQMNTRKRDEYFTQKKFNLFHEEYEGYTALISEFYAIFNNAENAFLVDHAVNVVYSLIGHYLLDPNRVLDIIIDISANYLVGNHHFIISFFKKSPWWPQVQGNCSGGLDSLNEGGSPAVVSSIALRLLKQTPDREIPETFKILIALFIKEGLISFGQIYPYFSPSDEDMDILERTYKKELEEKVLRASASALALAAPLAEEDDTDGTSEKKAKATSSTATDTSDSMVNFNVRFQMLKCFLGNGLYWPSLYILSRHPYLVHIDAEISELMHRALAAIIDPAHSKLSPFSEAQLGIFQEEKQSPRAFHKSHEESSIVQLYSYKPTTKSLGNRKYTYFIAEWACGLPVLDSAKDLHAVSRQFLKFFGPLLAANQANFIKLCEIVVSDLKTCSDEEKQIWLTYFRNYILPSIGFISENAIPVDKAYEILTFFSADDRFNLYGELYQVLAKSNPHVKIAYGKAEKATKDVLKRLSKENVEPMMRRLAKISLSNPLPCFLTILQQLESYDNLNTLVVETAAYFNDYGWDNLTLAIMMRLTSAGRSNKQANGLHERQWIQSLSSFVGKICQKYPNHVDLNTLLRYLLSSLHSSGSADLIVFREMLSSMGGIQSITNLTQLQIEMINCEPSMQKIVYKTIGDKRYEYHESGAMLRKGLMRNENINEFLILLCKINKELIDSPEVSHLKVLTSIKDEVDSVLHLLCTLVGFFGEDTSKLLSIQELLHAYDVPVVWAFEIWRDSLSSTEPDDVQSQVENALSSAYLQSTNSMLFAQFWKLRLYDIDFSPVLYDNELAKLKSKIFSLKEEYAFARRDKHASVTVLENTKSRISETEALTLALPSEKENHESHSKLVNERLFTQLDAALGTYNVNEAKSFMQICVLPRAVHSSFDAIYSAQFIFKLHQLRISNYSLITTLDVLFRNNIFFATLFTCTPTEAENLGMFVSAILKELNSWTDEDAFVKNTLEKKLHRVSSATDMTFADFRQSVFDYHTLLLQDVSRALEVTTYMSRMNAITYLKNLLGVYPIVEDHCEAVIELIDKISKGEKRDDLKLSSSALIGHVKSRKRSWVHLWDFIDMDEEAKTAQIQKRKDIEDSEMKKAQQEAEQKLEQQRLEQQKWREEEQAKRDAEKLEKQKQVQSKLISYDDGAKPTSRASSRSTEIVKGRYDNYSQGYSASAPRSTQPAETPKVETATTTTKATNSEESEKSEKTAIGGTTRTESTPQTEKTSLHAGAADNQRAAPTGPAGSKARQSTPDTSRSRDSGPVSRYGSSRETSARDAVSRDMPSRGPSRGSEAASGASFQQRSDRNKDEKAQKKETEHRKERSETPRESPGNSMLRSRLEMARKEHSSRNGVGKADVSSSHAGTKHDSSAHTSRSGTPVGPRLAQTAPSSSSSASGPAKAAGSRAPLPPPEHAPAGSSSSTSRDSGSTSGSARRAPLPPQAPPRDKHLPAYSSRAPLPPQSSGRAPPGNPPSGRSRTALPPQQPPQSTRDRLPAGPSESRGYRGSAETEDKGDRSSGGRFGGRGRRPSGDPLPPPSLPPPGKSSGRGDESQDRKRRFGDRGRPSDKRARY